MGRRGLHAKASSACAPEPRGERSGWLWAWEGQSRAAEATPQAYFSAESGQGLTWREHGPSETEAGLCPPAVAGTSGPAPDLFWGTSLPRGPPLPSGLGVVGGKSLAKGPALWIWVWGEGRWRGQHMDSLISQLVRAS